MIKENLAAVEERICSACSRSHRDRSEVCLIAVSKTKPVPMLQEAYDRMDAVYAELKKNC